MQSNKLNMSIVFNPNLKEKYLVDLFEVDLPFDSSIFLRFTNGGVFAGGDNSGYAVVSFQNEEDLLIETSGVYLTFFLSKKWLLTLLI